MDVFNPEVWKQQLAAFMNYPYIMLTGIAITAGVVWWLRGFQITIFKDRLTLAAEKLELADRAKNEVEKQFHAYKEPGGGNDAVAERVANIEAAIEKLSAANRAISSAITGIDDSFSKTPLALRAAQAEIINKWWK